MQPVLQSIIALTVILPLIVLTIYLLKRFSHFSAKTNNKLKVTAQISLTSKHQIVIVEMNTTQVILGLSPNHMEILDKQPISIQEKLKERAHA